MLRLSVPAPQQWTRTSFVQPQMHPYDRFFYDEVSGTYTVDKFVDELFEYRYV